MFSVSVYWAIGYGPLWTHTSCCVIAKADAALPRVCDFVNFDDVVPRHRNGTRQFRAAQLQTSGVAVAEGSSTLTWQVSLPLLPSIGRYFSLE